MSRIFSADDDQDKPRIGRKAVLDFFEERARKVEHLGAVKAVIYQDKAQGLAERRDEAEKALLLPKLGALDACRILDAGCGTGRWAEVLISRCAYYHGIDVSPGLIEVAQRLHGHRSNARFSVCDIDKLSCKTIGESAPFDLVLSVGVFIYLNDDEVVEALSRLPAMTASKARIVCREPVAVTNRLTLREHFSADMDQFYNAIYRPEAALLRMFEATLGLAGFSLVDSGDVFGDFALNNRAETRQRYFVFER